MEGEGGGVGSKDTSHTGMHKCTHTHAHMNTHRHAHAHMQTGMRTCGILRELVNNSKLLLGKKDPQRTRTFGNWKP